MAKLKPGDQVVVKTDGAYYRSRGLSIGLKKFRVYTIRNIENRKNGKKEYKYLQLSEINSDHWFESRLFSLVHYRKFNFILGEESCTYSVGGVFVKDSFGEILVRDSVEEMKKSVESMFLHWNEEFIVKISEIDNKIQLQELRNNIMFYRFDNCGKIKLPEVKIKIVKTGFNL